MNLKELFIQNKYSTYGNQSILSDFIEPVLNYASLYRQMIDRINADQIKTILSGLIANARKKGEMRVLYTPALLPVPEKETDYHDILVSWIEENILKALSGLTELDLKYLYEIVNKQFLKIQVVYTKEFGTVYDRVGIFEDSDGNACAFTGGFNTTNPNEYEMIRIFRNWNPELAGYVRSEIKEFDLIWNHNNASLNCFDISEVLKSTLQILIHNFQHEVITLKDYQEEAIKAWCNHGYNGFYVMATGTGKTWTAIYSAKRFLAEHKANLIICAPYKHLLKQWAEDLIKAFPGVNPILISSENPTWAQDLKAELIHTRYEPDRQIIAVSTIKSFNSERFREALAFSQKENLLIVDEAHRFTQRPEELKEIYPYRLGLSATPYSGKSMEKGKELMDFFGGQVYNLPIETALERGCLVPYYYHPLFVHATEEEEKEFNRYTQKITTCFNQQGICTEPDLLATYLRARLRVISMAEEKTPALQKFLEGYRNHDHFIVYCGDGHQSDQRGEDKRHIQVVKEILSKLDFSASQFTAEENMQTRMELINAFNKGDITALAAIRCLDEGINIPSIESAIILSSNDDYREFVQRRGRILRTFKKKHHADIYDLIVLPSSECTGIANIEFRRFAEYARLALNREELDQQLESLLDEYGLDRNAINVFDYIEQEGETDE